MPEKDCGQGPSGEWERVPAFAGEDGHVYVNLFDDWGRHDVRMMAELALETFVGPRPSPQHRAHHINGNKLDNRSSNLEWSLPTTVPDRSCR
jgi:hypothetical protein